MFTLCILVHENLNIKCILRHQYSKTHAWCKWNIIHPQPNFRPSYPSTRMCTTVCTHQIGCKSKVMHLLFSHYKCSYSQRPGLESQGLAHRYVLENHVFNEHRQLHTTPWTQNLGLKYISCPLNKNTPNTTQFQNFQVSPLLLWP